MIPCPPAVPRRFGRRRTIPEKKSMYTGTLIEDLVAAVERVQTAVARAQKRESELSKQGRPKRTRTEMSESEEFAQPLGLGAADRNLGLFLVVHPQLIRTLEPGNDFADAIDVHKVGAMSPPE